MSPQRIQLQRTKGWRKPEGAIVVARPSRWGNPFTIAGCIDAGFATDAEQARKVCVEAFRSVTTYGEQSSWWSASCDPVLAHLWENLDDLRGHDLACWCPLELPDGSRAPCHADVLLVLANPDEVFPCAK